MPIRTEIFTFRLFFKRDKKNEVQKVFGQFKNFELHDPSYHEDEIVIYIQAIAYPIAISKQYKEIISKARSIGGFISYGQVSREFIDIDN